MRAIVRADELEVIIGPMRRRHVRQIMRIEKQVYPRPWTPSAFSSELSAPGSARRYFVARQGTRVLGYGGIMYVEDARDGASAAHITNIAVDPGAQRAKVGSRLMLTLCRVARNHGCKHLSLEVRHTNLAAQALYHRFGFLQEGVRKRYYENTDDAFVLWARNIDQPAFTERLGDLELEIAGVTIFDGVADADG
jgi:[ribosomal protein S18]-alanine N-acetyltransferase